MDSSPLFDNAIDSQVGAKKPSMAYQRRAFLAGWSSLFLATTAGFLFIRAGMGIDADRRERIPIVTWKRSAERLSVAACLASWTAFGMALYSLEPTKRRYGSRSRHASPRGPRSAYSSGPANSRLAPGRFAIFVFIIENTIFLLYLGALYET